MYELVCGLRGHLAAAALVLALGWCLCDAPAAGKRVAIRVDCAAAGACERAEAVALDVWSEERGAGLPLDVVVAERALSGLDHYDVIVPDIDAVAAAERERLHAL